MVIYMNKLLICMKGGNFMELYEDGNAIREMDIGSILTNTFFRMFLGLLASAGTAFYVYYSGLYISMIQGGYFLYLAIAEIVVVLAFSLLFRKLPATVVTLLFFAYAFINGFTLSVIFAAFEMSSIVYAFLGTAALFGILAFIGHNTSIDVSKWGTVLSVALIVGLVLTIVNIFVGSSTLDIALDWGILLVFFGLTVYDMNKIKLIQEQGFCEDEKIYVYGAMELYLDFINIFLRILSIFGKSKD